MATQFPTVFIATQARIFSSNISSSPHDLPSQTYGVLPYCIDFRLARSFGSMLEPRYIFGAGPLDQ